MEARVLRKSENKVHVLDSLTGGTFHQIIYHTYNVEFPAMFPHIQDTFVCIHNHLEVRIGIYHMDKRLVFVIILVNSDGGLLG